MPRSNIILITPVVLAAACGSNDFVAVANGALD